MADEKTYWKKLQDPRWQKKRLEILERDEFTCVLCCDDSKTLHVHHGCYIENRDPWEYPDVYLWTLCEECHEAADSFRHDARIMCGHVHPELHQSLLHLLLALRDIDQYAAGGIIGEAIVELNRLRAETKDEKQHP